MVCLYGLFAANCVMLYDLFACLFRVCVPYFGVEKLFVCFVCDILCDVVWFVTVSFLLRLSACVLLVLF